MQDSVIDPREFGVSFSVKQCRNFGLDPRETLDWLIQAGFRRFRLMSYWDEHEQAPGKHTFKELDWQLNRIARADGQVTLCLGARQPRWPENHWPEWAWKLPKHRRSRALIDYVQKVVERYRKHPVIVSYQLENEALLASFGERSEVDRARLVREFRLVKKLDCNRPVIMTTSTSWGIPLRQPIPDVVGFSYYRVLYGKKGYHRSLHSPLLHRARAAAIALIKERPVFIHELQLEPWGPKAIWEMLAQEQDKSMSVAHIYKNIQLARRTKLQPIDLWGGEWWYWRLQKRDDPTIWEAVHAAVQSP